MEAAARTKPHAYQERDIRRIFELLQEKGPGFRLLYQLPTGGGKTVIFTEIARRYLEQFGGNVTILAHRTELCQQTARTLRRAGVETRVVDAGSRVMKKRECPCVVAMVETLNNQMRNKRVHVHNVGLVIVDEAHFNAFRKLLPQFTDAVVIGVTATPISADRELPLNTVYDMLLEGEPVSGLVEQEFLARPKVVTCEVGLESLHLHRNGDFSITSSDRLYASPAFQELFLSQYEAHAKGKKTIIFNAGTETSQRVEKTFSASGYAIRHLDFRTSSAERRDILSWFHKTRGAILTSVSILTTGFDEPGVQAVILNRATTSLALYHQMVGRGSRRLPRKKSFTIIDLGNNYARLGAWHEPLDWQSIFSDPDAWYDKIGHASGGGTSALDTATRLQFGNTLSVGFDVEGAVEEAEKQGHRHAEAISKSTRQHALMCLENAATVSEALKLADGLEKDIRKRVTEYVRQLDKPSKSYKQWLTEDHRKRLEVMIRRLFRKKHSA